ncbi:unnamed protein product [Effrenium voratum]|nr:unnamed protein product [Effrenium voratum]
MTAMQCATAWRGLALRPWQGQALSQARLYRYSARPTGATGCQAPLASLAAATIGCTAGLRRNLAMAAGDEQRVAADGDAVLINYTGKLKDGTVFDSTAGRSPLTFTLGSGQVIPGFEEAVRGLKPGDETEVSIPPEKAYGERNEALVMTVPADKAPQGLEEGMSVELGTTGARKIPAMVTQIAADGTVTIDANPPLAGQTLNFKIGFVEFKELLAPSTPPAGKEFATFAAGCFWGVEIAFQRAPGVTGTSVGYAQGQSEKPTYEEVCTGSSGHTEAVRVVYDPSAVSFEQLLETFWERVGKNATTLNRAGNDEGTQYRSGIYYHNDEQKAAAEASIKSLEDPGSGMEDPRSGMEDPGNGQHLSWCKDLAPGASWRKGGDRSRSCCALLACGGRPPAVPGQGWALWPATERGKGQQGGEIRCYG